MKKKTCSDSKELFDVENVLKTELLWAATRFLFGSENWEEQLKTTLFTQIF